MDLAHIAIGSTADGATLRVRVAPGARRDAIVGAYGEALKVAVRQPPEKGRANKEVCRLVARALDLSPRAVSVLRGETARDKVLVCEGVDVETLRARVRSLLVSLAAS